MRMENSALVSRSVI